MLKVRNVVSVLLICTTEVQIKDIITFMLSTKINIGTVDKIFKKKKFYYFSFNMNLQLGLLRFCLDMTA